MAAVSGVDDDLADLQSQGANQGAIAVGGRLGLVNIDSGAAARCLVLAVRLFASEGRQGGPIFVAAAGLISGWIQLGDGVVVVIWLHHALTLGGRRLPISWRALLEPLRPRHPNRLNCRTPSVITVFVGPGGRLS